MKRCGLTMEVLDSRQLLTSLSDAVELPPAGETIPVTYVVTNVGTREPTSHAPGVTFDGRHVTLDISSL